MKTGQEKALLIGILIFAALLVFPGLGGNCLWEDEAQTAVVAQNILSQGVPAASDGTNLVSIFRNHRDINQGIYIWQGWLPTYLAAGSMAVWGQDSFGARFPFAVAFVVLIGVFHAFLKKWHPGHPHQTWVALALTVTCVPLLLHARQCRYYLLVPLFNLLIVDAYLSFLKGAAVRHMAWLIVWSTALVNTFFPGAFVLAGALLIDVIRRRPGWRCLKMLAVCLGIVILINAPMAWFCRIWDRKFGPQPGYTSFSAYWMYFLRYVITLNNYFLPLILVAAACLMRWKDLVRRNTDEGGIGFLFLAISVMHFIGFSALADFPFTRYLIGLVPFAMFFAASCLEAMSFNRAWVTWALVLLIAGTNALQVLPLPLLRKTKLQNAPWTTAGIDCRLLGRRGAGVKFAKGEIKELINLPLGFPIVDYVRSAVHPPQGPIDCIVDCLNQNAQPSDRVKIAYGDLPLMFHTRLEIVSSTVVGAPAPEWIIYRHFSLMETNAEFLNETAKHPYSQIRLPCPDIQWNNQPDPLYHYYGAPAPELAPPLVLQKKVN